MRQHYLATLPGFGSTPREEGMVHRDKNARTVPSFFFLISSGHWDSASARMRPILETQAWNKNAAAGLSTLIHLK